MCWRCRYEQCSATRQVEDFAGAIDGLWDGFDEEAEVWTRMADIPTASPAGIKSTVAE